MTNRVVLRSKHPRFRLNLKSRRMTNGMKLHQLKKTPDKLLIYQQILKRKRIKTSDYVIINRIVQYNITFICR